jgi:membrane associated rhomboid family serine protease
MKNYYSSFWLSLACIIVFALQNLVSGLTELFILDQSKYIEVWRFVSSIFLHGSIIHLALNLFALILFGLILESVIGSRNFLKVFFISGIFANLIAINFYPLSLGASGAIYGILGCLAILRPKMVVWVFNLPMPMFLAAILWVIAGVLGVFMPSNVGDIAHLSGIAVGFIFGLFYLKRFGAEKREARKRIWIDERSMRNWEERVMR